MAMLDSDRMTTMQQNLQHIRAEIRLCSQQPCYQIRHIPAVARRRGWGPHDFELQIMSRGPSGRCAARTDALGGLHRL